MKKSLSLLMFFCVIIAAVYAQTPPEKMSYQVVVRNNNNELIVNQQVGIKISILEDNINGGAVFIETHTVTTNTNALATIQVGTGTPVLVTTLADVDWKNHDYYIKAEIDPLGGTNYTITGTQQLITVPYSFYSGKSGFSDTSNYNNLINRPMGTNTGDLLYWDASDSSWQVVPVGSAGQVLTLNPNGVPQWYSTVFNQSAPPTIVTDTVYDITGYTMRVKCTIINSGTTGIIASGVCWSSSNPTPSIGNNQTTDGSSVGSFVSSVSGLSSNTTYYVCAYATNSVGTSYGNVIAIQTPTHCSTVTDIDGNVYNSVYIGRQCWMKENLRTKTYADGIVIPMADNLALSMETMEAHNESSNPSICYYYSNNDSSNVNEVGLLYTWETVMKGAGSSNSNPSGILGICPYGWHVPSSAEWCELENLLNTGIDVNCSNNNWRGTMAKVLSAPKNWSADSGNSFFPGYWHTDATGFNTTGFSMLPNGYRKLYQTYSSYWSVCNNNSYHIHTSYPTYDKTTAAYFWTAVKGEYRMFSTSQTGSYYGNAEPTTSAMSVRCLKDYN
ncbi:MAG: hypothetical protein MJZ76_08685 [Bacteroidales bacterium]|nr:hypothetical protein [Bacteroidales bacterium]